ncbi:MAG TPA: hypothetical protein VM616_06320 [Gammaproteobacteria bacterium]|nr:hypothetical protein [Gammaproteobacteria bacterium]
MTATMLVDTNPIGNPPKLPKRDDGELWHPEASRTWRDIWDSPMASEYTQVDVHRVEMYVDLIHRYWKGETEFASEIRLQGVCLGITPIDRRRLQWTISRVEPKERRPQRVADPRAMLRPVS